MKKTWFYTLISIFSIIFSVLMDACQPDQTRLFLESNGGETVSSKETNGVNDLNELPIPEYEGHILLGWFFEASLETQVDENLFDSILQQSSVILYAKWDVQEYVLKVQQYRQLNVELAATQGHITDVVLGEKQRHIHMGIKSIWSN